MAGNHGGGPAVLRSKNITAHQRFAEEHLDTYDSTLLQLQAYVGDNVLQCGHYRGITVMRLGLLCFGGW